MLGIVFAIVYAVMATINYLIQLVVVRFSILSGQTEGLNVFLMGYPYSVFKALANSYAYQSIALFFTAWAFWGSKLQDRIRWIFIIVGLTAPFQLAFTLFDLDYRIILPITAFWVVGIPLGCIVLALLFKRSQTNI